jgi:hypothetical protein
MAVTVGMDVSIVDPRDAFATDDRFPGAKIFATWPDEAFEQVSPDADTAIVAVARAAASYKTQPVRGAFMTQTQTARL